MAAWKPAIEFIGIYQRLIINCYTSELLSYLDRAAFETACRWALVRDVTAGRLGQPLKSLIKVRGLEDNMDTPSYVEVLFRARPRTNKLGRRKRRGSYLPNCMEVLMGLFAHSARFQVRAYAFIDAYVSD